MAEMISPSRSTVTRGSHPVAAGRGVRPGGNFALVAGDTGGNGSNAAVCSSDLSTVTRQSARRPSGNAVAANGMNGS